MTKHHTICPRPARLVTTIHVFVLEVLMLTLTVSASGQDSQFTFDPNGNLLIESPAVVVAPQILSQPQPQIVGPGELASFFVVVADSRALTYQWRFNDANISGATNETLLLQNVGATNQGQYSVVLVNPSGSVTSAPSMLWFDGDGDTLPDSWELANFGNLNQYGAGDFDRDGVSNSQEFLDTTSPTNRASARFRLTVSTDGGGLVQVSPALLSYTNGQTVTLTATPAAPNIFRGWTGDLITQSNPVTLIMTSNRNVLALFFGLYLMWTNRLNGDWHVAANWRPNVVPTSNDTVFITEGVTVTNNSVAECSRLFLGPSALNWPTLTGNGTLILYGDSVWMEGTMSGTGRTIVAPGATLSIAREPALNAVTLRTRTLENAGTTLWIGGNLDTDGGVITNRPGAVFEVQNASPLLSVSGFGLGRFDNAGTFRKTSLGTTTIGQFTAFNNYGDVEVQDGTLLLQGGGRNEGTMALHAGATLHLPGSTFNSTAGSSISGAGNLIVSGGTHNLAGLVHLEGTHTFSAGTANFTGDYSCTNNTIIVSSGTANFSGTGVIMPATVSLSGGSLAGSRALTVLNDFNWSGGTMSGSGWTVIAPGAVLNISSSAVHFLSGGRRLENGGTVLWTAGFLTMGGATITNRAGALFDNQTPVAVNSGGGNRFDNAGTFRKSVSAGTATWPVTFNNSGLVEIETGRLVLDGAGTNTSMIEIAAGASLNLSSGGAAFISTAGSSISGAGDFIVSGNATLSGLVNPGGTHTFSGGIANLNGNYVCTNNPATISGGGTTVNFNSTSAVTVVNFSSGTLSGSGVLNVLQTMNWSGGFMGGSGRTVIAPGAMLNFNNGADVTINTRTLENGGTVIWTGAGNLTASAAVITNRPGALFEVRNNAMLSPQGFQAWRFDNAGTFRKAIATGTTTFASGVSLNNYNTVDIRSGRLAANGGYTSRSNALLNCAIGGTNAGVGFGQLQVAGTVNLNGSLSVDLINGFIPATNDSFTVLTAGTRAGSFANFFYPSNEVTMQLSNTPTSVIVRVANVMPANLMFLHPQIAGSDVLLTWSSFSNSTYRIEFKTDLGSTNWDALPGDVIGTSNTASKLDSLTPSNRFYRVRIIP
jgi:hypothetical protein